jgi:DNA polymerase-3 subunit delta'
MHFEEIIGQDHIKKHLAKTAENGRVPHAQLFVAPQGTGALPMAVAYTQLVMCDLDTTKPYALRERCREKIKRLMHPDLHFVFPVAANSKVKDHPVSDKFLDDWREFVTETPYGSLYNWYQKIGIENKQGQIGVDEAEDIVKKLSLKPYEGGFKVMIIWMVEKMNVSAANKLLKLIEEPPDKTVLILITEDEEQLLKTIVSRCQVLHFKPLSEFEIKNALIRNEHAEPNTAMKIAHRANGNYNSAVHLLHDASNDLIFEKWL